MWLTLLWLPSFTHPQCPQPIIGSASMQILSKIQPKPWPLQRDLVAFLSLYWAASAGVHRKGLTSQSVLVEVCCILATHPATTLELRNGFNQLQFYYENRVNSLVMLTVLKGWGGGCVCVCYCAELYTFMSSFYSTVPSSIPRSSPGPIRTGMPLCEVLF